LPGQPGGQGGFAAAAAAVDGQQGGGAGGLQGPGGRQHGGGGVPLAGAHASRARRARATALSRYSSRRQSWAPAICTPQWEAGIRIFSAAAPETAAAIRGETSPRIPLARIMPMGPRIRSAREAL